MRRQDFKIEVCTNSVESVRAALAGGADRIELCAGMPEGGTTPSYGEICLVRELMPAGMHVIVRPRGGDFLYREDELEVIFCKDSSQITLRSIQFQRFHRDCHGR